MMAVSGRQLQRETVPAETRHDMQMDVRDLLAGPLAVCQEQVHRLAPKNGDCTPPSRRRGHIRDAFLASLCGRVPYENCPLGGTVPIWPSLGLSPAIARDRVPIPTAN